MSRKMISTSKIKIWVKTLADEIYLTIFFLHFQTEQYPELLSVEVLRDERGRQAEKEGN